ncbi:MAG: hypothetical protein HOP03_08980 [Lysobacter sp.]|nr:hypothetical protein [Lysobacter sp.]
MHTAIHRKTLLCASLFAAAFAIFLAQAAEPGAALKPAAALDSDAPLEPLPPDDDPDAPLDPPIPDPYAGLPEQAPVDEALAKGEWLRMTFLVHSGLPSPTVLLAPGDDFDSVEQSLAKATTNPEKIIEAYSPEPVLGYNGVLLERFSDGVPRYSYTVQDNILSTGPEEADENNYALVSDTVIALETSLLSIGTSYKALDSAMLSVIEQTKADPRK